MSQHTPSVDLYLQRLTRYPLILFLMAQPLDLSAASRTWNGSGGTDFENAASWSALPTNDLATDIGVFSGSVTGNLPRLSASRGISGLLFSTGTGGWMLDSSAAGNVLTLGGSGISTAGQTSGTNTIAANLALGASQPWLVGTGGRLLVTGSITQAAGFASWTINNSGNLGTLTLSPSAGNSMNVAAVNDAASMVQVKSGGVLQLGGIGADSTTSSNTIKSTSSTGGYCTWGITGSGKVQVNSGNWITGDLGKNGGDNFSGTIEVTGGSISFTGARYLGSGSILVSGGNLSVTGFGSTMSNGGRFSLGAYASAGTATMTISGGTVDLAQANGGNTLGTATSTRVNQSGGILQNGVTVGGGTNGGTVATLTIGATGLTSIGSGTTLTYTAVSNILASYTLSGGTLLSAGAIQGSTPAIPGTNGSAATPPNTVVNPGTGNVRNFNFNGGILATAAFNATNLGYASSNGSAGAPPNADPAANSVGIGTLYNNGGSLAPGGVGVAGKTAITGNYAVNMGTLAIDLGGTVLASAFQTGQYDYLTASGTTTLAGDLSVSVLPGFTPTAGDTFTVLTSSGILSGSFANAPFGSRITSVDGHATFVVSQVGNTVTLGEYLPVSAPVVTDTTAPSTVIVGDAVVLGITVSSLAPVTYEWRKNGVIISGATSSALTLLSVAAADSGTYEVTASNAEGSVSRSFTLIVKTPPVTGNIVLDAGTSTNFAASPQATSQSWILDGDVVGSASTFTYTPAAKAVGTHWLRVVETYADNSTATRQWAVRVRIPTPVSALSYYVSPTGSDSASGSSGAPFATLEKARDTIRSLSAGQRAGGVTVFLRGGIHRRTSTFALTSSDSGTASAPVVYAAYPGETPVLTSTRVLASSQFAPLAASEHARAAPGVDVTRIWEVDVSGNARAAAFPAVFNEWWIYNALRSSLNGGLLELFYQGERQRISRYPNQDLSNDILTPNLEMNGVATGTAVDGSGYLNGAGTYTLSSGGTTAVGGAFHYDDADASRISRWQTALNSGGLWVMGYWRVPWQLNGARVGLIDLGKKAIGLVTNPSNANSALVSNGIGDKYNRPLGSKKEPWWVVNLLEELDQPGEWCIDFNRQRLYFLMDRAGAPADGEIELADAGTPLVQLNGASDVRLQGLTFRRHLGINVQILNGERVLVLDCAFSQSGNLAIDINGGTGHGVVSSDFEKMASGGVMLRGGQISPTAVPADHFAVNNKFRSFGEVVRVYQSAVDVGYGGPLGSWGLPTVGMRVAHNDIRTSPHAGILWNGYQHAIEYNELSDFTRVSNDLGGIYRFGPNIDANTVIRYNHLYASPQGEGIYNDFDHVRTPIYGNTINLKTPSTSSRGYGIWTNTNTAVGGAVAGLPMTLQVFNNIAVNSRSNYSLHSATGGVIQNNLSYRKLASDFLWYRVTTDTGTNTNSVASSNAATLQSGLNPTYSIDPGFIDFANDDLRLRPDATAYTDMPGFVPIPLEMSGIYQDESRADARVWTPFIITGTATSVGSNSANFNGTLVYPQFDANATVRLYWGTSDGGTEPAAWQNTTVVGQPSSGQVTQTLVNLEPATRYFFRFHAENTAGAHWAEQSNSVTTLPLMAAPVGGSATSDSGATPAGFAFDGNPATAWLTANGSPVGTLTYQFAAGATAVITRYTVTSAADTPSRDPRDWRFLGSYDGVAWVVLDVRAAQTFTARGQTLEFGFSNSTAFHFYRLEITANAGDPDALHLAELGLFGPQLLPDTVGPVITSPGDLVVSGYSSGATVTFEVSALDAVSGNAIATASPASGSLFPIGETTVTVTASDPAGNESVATFKVTVTAPVLPSPWSVMQIQPFSGVAPGTAITPSADALEITGSGGSTAGGTTGDMWTGTNDSFTYVSQPWTGDGIFTARLAAFTSTDSSAKAGIVFRETTSAGSRYSSVYLLRKGDAWAQHKTATSGGSTNVNFFTTSSTGRGIPEWIRLVREGDAFSCYYSSNGSSWTQLGSTRTDLLGGSSLSVGFAVAPRTGNTSATALFDNISFLSPLQDWRQTNFGTTSTTGPAADDADPDGDGMKNLIEYALGTLPNSATSVSAPVLGTAGDRLTLAFTRARGDVTCIVEGCSDLANWESVATNPGNIGQSVTVTDTVDISTANPPRRFLRLRVTTP